jgi:hypothetical protein
MFEKETVMVKCSRCGKATVDKVNTKDYRAGKAIIYCEYGCGPIRLRKTPMWKTLSLELIGDVKNFVLAFFRMGIKKIILFSSIGVGGWFCLTHYLHLSDHSAILISIAPFIIALCNESVKLWKKDWGLSDPPSLPTLKVISISEEYQFIYSQHCPRCKHNNFKLGEHTMIPLEPSLLHTSKFSDGMKVIDRIYVQCNYCGNKMAFYFNIDEIPYVRRLGYTQNMINFHLKLIKEFRDTETL